MTDHRIKIHIIDSSSSNTIVTRCGRVGFKTSVGDNEFDTADCNRIHAVPRGTTGEDEPTCARCLAPRKINPRHHI